jgi:hypothetical protein
LIITVRDGSLSCPIFAIVCDPDHARTKKSLMSNTIPTELWYQISLYLSPKDFMNLLASDRKISSFDQRITFNTKVRYRSPALICADSFTQTAFEFIYRNFAHEIPSYRALLSRLPLDIIEVGFEYLSSSEFRKDVVVLRCLFEAGINRVFGHQLPLKTFIELGQLDLVREIVEHPFCEPSQIYALVMAARLGSLEMVELLVDKDPDPHALLFACQLGYLDIVRFLMNRVDYRHGNGRAFILACLFNRPKIVHLLLCHDYFLEETLLRDGLGFATYYGYLEVIMTIFEKYTPPSILVRQLLQSCHQPKTAGFLHNMLARIVS